jgi:hypothetical protein
MEKLDTSIYQNWLRPPKSVQEYDDESQQRDLNQLQMQSQRMQVNALRQGQQDDERLRNFLSGGADLSTPQGRAGLYAASPVKASAILKDQADLARTQAQTDEANAKTQQTKYEFNRKKLEHGIQSLTSASTPEAARQAITDGVAQGFWTMGEAQQRMAQVPMDQQAYQQWRQSHLMSIVGAKDQLEMSAPKPTEIRLGDKVVTIDLNPRSQTYKQQVTSNAVGVSPDTKANNAVAIRGQNLTDARARDFNTITEQGNAIKGETDLRKEFSELPEVKNYKQASPAYSAIVDASKRNTPQADINLVYGIAKLYDPNSVVREGEYATVANSPAIPERIKGYAQYLAGGGRLTPDVKNQIVAEAKGRIGTYKTEYDNAKRSYEGVAKKRGLSSDQVFTDIGGSAAGGTPSDVDAILNKYGVK